MKTIDADSFPPSRATRSDEGAWFVMKFGGTSVASPDRWGTIVELVRERRAAGYRVLIVHSALAGISDRLLLALEAAIADEHEPLLRDVVDTHLQLAADLGLDGARELLAEYIATLEQLLAGIRLVREVSPRVHVNVMALGELMATTIGAAVLRDAGLDAHWIDAREALCSIDAPNDSERARYLRAQCSFEPDRALADRLAALGDVIVTQGFIARNEEGEGVLLGRGGSDTSGAYFAAKLRARALEIWTDVPGLFSAKPQAVPGARLLKVLSFDQAQEIASMGGSVLHPRCLRPVRRYGIPLRVRSTLIPELQGTLISDDPGSDAPRVKAISSRTGITVVSMETVGMWHEVGFLADAFSCFRDAGISVDLVSTGESNVTVTLDTAAGAIDPAALARLRRRLERICRVNIIENTEVVSLVGQKIRAMLHVIGPALEVFQEHRIHLVSQAANDLNLSFVVEEGQAHRLIQKLHSSLVKPTVEDPIFGATWEELQQESAPSAPAPAPWWVRHRSRLLEIAQAQPAAYVYDLDTVREACARLTALRNVDRTLFAMKANNHADVLATVVDAGVGLECVSPQEIQRAVELFPQLPRERILFTPNFAPRQEYEAALEAGVRVTLDNLHPLRHWPDAFAGRELMLRLDTGQGRGHHEHVRTAGVHSKFGIPLFELDEAAELAASCGARITGLHAHTGSGILRADNWEDIAGELAAAAGRFPEARVLDVGGGLGVPERTGDRPLDMAGVDASLGRVREAFPDYEIWLEPGRYIVAEAGVLLVRVTQTKGKGDVMYVGVTTGMNSLIRPALYGAFHEIVNLSRLGEPPVGLMNVVGPICETGDRLGSDRRLPDCREGDVLLIGNAGAYGAVMSSRYNLRDPAVEIALTG